MPKTTLYHPVSIYVIRGSFDYSEFGIGRLRQIWSNQSLGQAGYVAELTSCPKGFLSKSIKGQLEAINRIFASDIQVTGIVTRMTLRGKSHRIQISIQTYAHPNSDPHLPGEIQPLLPEQSPLPESTHDLAWLTEEPVGQFLDGVPDISNRDSGHNYDIPF